MTDIPTAADLLAAIEPAVGGRPIPDPATGEVVGRAPEHDVADLEAAIDRAVAAQTGWAALSHARRAEYLIAAAEAVEAEADALAHLLSRETGKPLSGAARMEVGGCALWLRATAALELEPQTIIDDANGRSVLHYRALGVVGAIAPWNFPMMISVWQVAPALLMGNAVVAKPSEFTPLSGLALVHVIARVLPPDVLQIVVGGRDVGAALAAHPAIAKIMFTGSTATGKAIIRSSADTVKRLTLELGGNDAGIVLPDADVDAIAEKLFWGAFVNSGQVCAALKRLYVHDSVYDAVCAALVEIAGRTPMGDPLAEESLLGPLQNRAQFDIVAGLVDAARASGSRILVGGDPDPAAAGHFYPLTLVADIPAGDPLVVEEQFGPALPIIRYSEIDDAVRLANELDAGLGASVWSSDPERAQEVAGRLEAGTVWINAHGAVHPRVPFGGVKESGYGLEFGVEGLKQLATAQVIRS